MSVCLTAFLMGYLEKTAVSVTDVIAQIESSGNPAAVSKKGTDVGLHQNTPIAVKQFNQTYPGKNYTLQDMLDPVKSLEVTQGNLKTYSDDFQRRHKREPTELEQATMHHRSFYGNEKGGPITGRYRIKYDRIKKRMMKQTP